MLKRSPLLADLYKAALEEEPTDAVYYKNSANQPLDKLIKATGTCMSFFGIESNEAGVSSDVDVMLFCRTSQVYLNVSTK